MCCAAPLVLHLWKNDPHTIYSCESCARATDVEMTYDFIKMLYCYSKAVPRRETLFDVLALYLI